MSKKFGTTILEARKRAQLTQEELAQAAGYSTVMVRLIEKGQRFPSASGIESLAGVLGLEVEPLKQLLPTDTHVGAARARGASGSRREPVKGGSAPSSRLKVAQATKLSKQNEERAAALAERYKRAAEGAQEEGKFLSDRSARFVEEIQPLMSDVLSRVSHIDEDFVVRGAADSSGYSGGGGRDAFENMAKDAEFRISKGFYSMLGTGALGGAAGAALGGGAAAGAFSMVAALASASTGTAISALSGAAATSATMAWLGGGSLAAGGLGVAGGTAVLTGIVAFPILAVMGGAVLMWGGRALDKQLAQQKRLEQLEERIEQLEGTSEKFQVRASKIGRALEFAGVVVANQYEVLKSNLSAAPETVPFEKLSPETKAALQRIFDVTLAAVLLLSLPIGAHLAGDAAAIQQLAGSEEPDPAESQPEESSNGPAIEEEFIDFMIDENRKKILR